MNLFSREAAGQELSILLFPLQYPQTSPSLPSALSIRQTAFAQEMNSIPHLQPNHFLEHRREHNDSI